MVIVINYVIGELSWGHSIWLADVTVRFQVSNYSQLFVLTVPFQPYTILSEIKAVNAPIKFEKIVMVLIKPKIGNETIAD